MDENKTWANVAQNKNNNDLFRIKYMDGNPSWPNIPESRPKNKTLKNDEILKREQSKKHNFDQIHEHIKTVCCDRADVSKKAYYELYKSINRPNPAQLAEIEYYKTYNNYYEAILKHIVGNDVNVIASEIGEFQLAYEEEDEEEDEEEMVIVEKQMPIVEEKLVVNDDKETEVAQIATRFDSSDWKQVASTKTTKTMSKDDKNKQLGFWATSFAEDIVNRYEMKDGNEFRVNCQGVVVGKLNNGAVVNPNKFLDPTYIEGAGTVQSGAHRLFKSKFYEVLKSRFGENHNLHMKFTKDSSNPMIFYINVETFKTKEPQENWVAQTKTTNKDSKINFVKSADH